MDRATRSRHDGRIKKIRTPHIRATLATVLAVSAALADPALAQSRYFARQKIMPAVAQTFSYEPVYTWGACDGTNKTATYSSCKRSDGTTVAKSLCGTQPATKTEKCTLTYSCDPVVAGNYLKNTQTSYYITKISRTSGWEQVAAGLCRDNMYRNPKFNVCVADTYQGAETTMIVTLATAQIQTGVDPTYYSASQCRAN